MAVALVPPGPNVPPELAELMRSWYLALLELQQPTSPQPLFEIDTEANLLAQAPAADFPNCAAIVTDVNCVAISTNVAGTWTWLRADGSAL